MISFVIPTLNEIKTIEQTLQCVSGYSGEHEIIVSDGNSQDGTVEIASRYADKIVVHDKPERQTIAMARNVGAAAAGGDYLVFLDADVLIRDINGFFRTAKKVFEQNERLLALTVHYRVLPETRTLIDRIVFAMLSIQLRLQNNVFRFGGSGGEFQMIVADAFRKVGGFDESLAAAEDMDLFRRLSRLGRTRFEPSLAVYHTGRRAHAIGWRNLIWQWFRNSMSVWFLKKSASKEWKEIR
jgi:glycosyltransferase involved in cell wall biosynthesis